jgi:hypothetical protein
MGKLKVPISSFSNIVITERVSVDDYTFIPEKKGLIETNAKDNNEKERKLEEIRKFCALLTLQISEERNGIFYIFPEEALFFTPSYGVGTNGKLIPIDVAYGSIETCLDGEHIKKHFLLFKKILSERKNFLRSIQWYHLGNISLDEINSIISYITAIEILFNLIDKPFLASADGLLEKEIENITRTIKNLKEIRDQTKNRAIDRIRKILTEKSFKEKMELIKEKFTKEEFEKLMKKAKNLGLNEDLGELFSQLQSDRGKILHQKGGDIEKSIQKKKWLELFTRIALLKEINTICLYNEKK